MNLKLTLWRECRPEQQPEPWSPTGRGRKWSCAACDARSTPLLPGCGTNGRGQVTDLTQSRCSINGSLQRQGHPGMLPFQVCLQDKGEDNTFCFPLPYLVNSVGENQHLGQGQTKVILKTKWKKIKKSVRVGRWNKMREAVNP